MKYDKQLRVLLIAVILASALAYIAATGLKSLFQVPRPCELIDTCPDSFSFPSRQTSIAFAVATVFALVTRKKHYSIAAFALAALVGYWRISLGVHTIYDIIGGVVVGVGVGYVVYYILKSIP